MATKLGTTPWWDRVFDAPIIDPTLGLPTGGTIPISPGYEGPLNSPNPWDTLIVNGRKFPGIAEVVHCEPKRRVDKKKQAGSDGGNPTIHGYEPTNIEVRVTIWTPLQLATLDDIIQTLWPAVRKSGPPQPVAGVSNPSQIAAGIIASTVAGAAAGAASPLAAVVGAAAIPYAAYTIYHPALAQVRINAAILVGISALRPGKQPGAKEQTFLFEEFNPIIGTKKATSSPKRVNLDQRLAPPAGAAPPAAVAQPGVNYTPANAMQSPPGQNASFIDPTYTAPGS